MKGIWIPIEIWQAEDLSWNEKILLMEVDSFSKKGKECYISNRYIADMFGISERTASEYLTHLIKAGYVKLVKFDGRVRYVESALQSLQGSIEENFKADLQNTSMQGGKKLQGTNNIKDLNKRTDSNTPLPPFDFYKALINAGVTPETAEAWLVVRKAKRSVNSELAFRETMKEVRKSGRSAEECIRFSAARSWAGFMAQWLEREENGTGIARARKVDNITFMLEQRERRQAERARQQQGPSYDINDLPDEQ